MLVWLISTLLNEMIHIIIGIIIIIIIKRCWIVKKIQCIERCSSYFSWPGGGVNFAMSALLASRYRLAQSSMVRVLSSSSCESPSSAWLCISREASSFDTDEVKTEVSPVSPSVSSVSSTMVLTSCNGEMVKRPHSNHGLGTGKKMQPQLRLYIWLWLWLYHCQMLCYLSYFK